MFFHPSHMSSCLSTLSSSKSYTTLGGEHWAWQEGKGAKWDFSGGNPQPCMDAWQGVGCSCNISNNYHPESYYYIAYDDINTDNNASSILCTVTSLELPNYNLTGKLADTSQSLNNLLELTRLNLQRNALTGPLPNFYLPSLHILAFGHNALTGTIPAVYDNLGKLESLILRTNSLRGTIPTLLKSLSKLRFLYLSDNSFSSTIPSFLSVLNRTLLEVNCIAPTLAPTFSIHLKKS